MFLPTCTICGISSGYTGKGARNIIPGKAICKIEMRLVDNQVPEVIFEKLKAHIAKHNPDIKLTPTAFSLPSSTQTDLPVSLAVIDAARKTFGMEPFVVPRLGASSPDSYWTKNVGLPTMLVPYANADENNHAPNENLDLDCFYRGIHCSAEVFNSVGQLSDKN